MSTSNEIPADFLAAVGALVRQAQASSHLPANAVVSLDGTTLGTVSSLASGS